MTLRNPISKSTDITSSDRPTQEDANNDKHPALKTPGIRRPFERHSVSQLLQLPPKEWLIEGLLGQGDLAVLVGRPAAGKSFIALDLAVSLASGAETFANKFHICRPANVLYVACERFKSLPGRCRASLASHSLAPEKIDDRFEFVNGAPNLFDGRGERGTDGFLSFIADGARPDLLIIDTFHAATRGMNENDAKDMGPVLDSIDTIKEELACSVLLIHHTSKAGTQPRGSSALEGAADAIWLVEPYSRVQGKISCSKQSDAEAFEPLAFEINGHAASKSAFIAWQESCPTNKVRILEVLAGGEELTSAEIAERGRISPTTARQALIDLEKERRLESRLTQGHQPASKSNPKLYFTRRSDV